MFGFMIYIKGIDFRSIEKIYRFDRLLISNKKHNFRWNKGEMGTETLFLHLYDRWVGAVFQPSDPNRERNNKGGIPVISAHYSASISCVNWGNSISLHYSPASWTIRSLFYLIGLLLKQFCPYRMLGNVQGHIWYHKGAGAGWRYL